MNGLTPQALWTTIRRGRLIQVLAVYLGTSFLVLEAVDILTDRLGLPDWVFPGAVVLLLIGLPIILTTALVQRAPSPKLEAEAAHSVAPTPEAPRATTATDVAAVAKHWLTWRKAILGGVLAFALLGVATTGYMAMRVLGIGPVGSLVAAGVLEPGERIILAEFENHTGDSLLAGAATEAFRIDLAQSALVTLVESRYVSRVLQRMQKAPNTPLDRVLANEIAIREGIKAVVASEINAAGAGFVLSTRLVSAETGEVLAAYRERADSTGIIGAIDRLSKELRERIGESLRTIRSNEPLEKVTTPSLEALQKYSQALRAIEVEGDYRKGITLLEEAVTLDTAFAMAYRKLGVALSNLRQERARQVEALTKAFEHRDRLTDRERYLTLGTYYQIVTDEREKAITAYSTLLDTYPTFSGALNNLGILYLSVRDYARAEDLALRAFEVDSSSSSHYLNMMVVQVALGKFDEAKVTLQRFAENVPGNPEVELWGAALASTRGDYAAADARIRALRERQRGSLRLRAWTSGGLANLAKVRGQLTEAERHSGDAMAANEERGLPQEYLDIALQLALMDVRIRGKPDRGLQRLQAALGRYPLDSIVPLDRPYLRLARLYATAERPDRARALLSEYEETIDPELRRGAEPWRHRALGLVALAEDDPVQAIAELRVWDEGIGCAICALPDLGRAYELAGEADSALAIYERYVTTPWLWRLGRDSRNLALIYERLGALYEERGNTEKAIYYYGRLVELWKDADPELQPRVEAARRAIRALSPDR